MVRISVFQISKLRRATVGANGSHAVERFKFRQLVRTSIWIIFVAVGMGRSGELTKCLANILLRSGHGHVEDRIPVMLLDLVVHGEMLIGERCPEDWLVGAK